LNVATHAGTPLADRELREFKQRFGRTVNQSFHYHLARSIEMLHCVERIEELVSDPELLNKRTRARAGQNHSEGIGASEAPRGTLFHHYWVDESGLMKKANLLIATGQNNIAMNKTVEQAAKHFVNPLNLTEGMLNRVEAGIRCYDPCLSCSTHALGKMPMSVEVRNRGGELLRRYQR
jgi:NAD-reducing hydrogenase large subunit